MKALRHSANVILLTMTPEEAALVRRSLNMAMGRAYGHGGADALEVINAFSRLADEIAEVLEPEPQEP